MTWATGPLAPVGVPLGMGAMAGAEGMRGGRVARRVAESLRTAPGFARGASGLAARKAQHAEARRAYLAKLQNAWISGQKPITVAEARRRANQVRQVEAQIAQLSRQAATRSRAARRAARIARTGAPFRSSPTATEVWLRESLQSDPMTRVPASLTAGLLRSLQNTRRGLNNRRPRLYGDAEDQRQGKPCGQSHIPKGNECHKGTGVRVNPAGPGLTPAKVLGAAAVAGVTAAGVYAWRKRDSIELMAAMQDRPLADRSKRQPNLVERLLAERRVKRCGGRSDALPLSATNECAAKSAFGEIYLAKDLKTCFKVPMELDLRASKEEFKIHGQAFAAGVPTARPLTIHPKTGVIRMEYLQGRTGDELFGDRFDASHFPSYGLQLSAAMRKMHKQGIAHGDLHLGNWIETKDGIKLLDWGLGSRKRFDVLSEIEDSPVSLGLGLTSGPKGVISMHSALLGYEQLVNKTLIELDWLKPRTRGWTQAVNDHYDALDAMLRKAAGA
jgi:hypothetical protein